MNIDIKVASFERKTWCLVVNNEPQGKQYDEYKHAALERESLMHYACQSSSPDWLRLCRAEEEAA